VDAENGSEINLINPFKQAIDAIEKPSWRTSLGQWETKPLQER
jgi:hypothetical protein